MYLIRPILPLLILLSASSCHDKTNSDAINLNNNPLTPNATETTVNATPKIGNEGSNLRVALPPESRPYLSIKEIKAQNFAPIVQAPARIEFRTKALSTVGAVIAGRVGKINVQVGDRVKRGALMAILDSSAAAQTRADVERAQEELQRAQDRLQRQELMKKSGVGLEVERREAEIQLKQEQTEYQRSLQAAELLGKGVGPSVSLLSPTDGVVLRVMTNLGAAVESGAVLFEIGEPDALRVVADVFENELPMIAAGSKVSLQIDSANKILSGRVASVSATVQTDLRRASVFIDLDEPEPGLKPGMFARASIQGIGPNRIILPTTAVLIKGGKQTIVYVEVNEGVYESRPVELGPARENKVAVLNGLKDGERVVIKGTLLLDSEAEMLL